MLKAIHTQENKAAALAKVKDVVAALKEMKLKHAAKKVEDGVEETMSYMAFSFEHWTRIRTSNVMNGFNREIHHRTCVVGAFTDGNLTLMLVCVRLCHLVVTQ